MSDLQSPHDRPQPLPDSIDYATQTRSLRRKVIFWRRAAWLMLGAAGILALLIWQRGNMHCRLCHDALSEYARRADELKLSQQPVDLLEQQWKLLDEDRKASVSSVHYDLVVNNWYVKPKPGERLLLAICRTPHFVGFGQGRYALWREADGDRIEWVDEGEAEKLIAEAAKDNARR